MADVAEGFPAVHDSAILIYEWRRTGLWLRINHHLVMEARELEGRQASPSAGVGEIHLRPKHGSQSPISVSSSEGSQDTAIPEAFSSQALSISEVAVENDEVIASAAIDNVIVRAARNGIVGALYVGCMSHHRG